MKYNLTKSEFDALSDDLKKEYKAAGDGYTLKIDGMPDANAEDVKKLKETLDKVRDELKTAEKDLKKYKDIDPEKYKTLLSDQAKKEEALKQAELDLARKEKDVEKLEATLKREHQEMLDELTKTHTKTVEELNTKIAEAEKTAVQKTTELSSALENEMRDKRAIAALTTHKGDAFVLKDHVTRRLTVVKDETGAYVTRVVNPEAKGDDDKFMKDNDGKFWNEEHLVQQMKEDKRYANNFETGKLPGDQDTTDRQAHLPVKVRP